jgi:hypothetical protein
MRSEGIDFKQCSNAFLKCSHPDSITPELRVKLKPAVSQAQ